MKVLKWKSAFRLFVEGLLCPLLLLLCLLTAGVAIVAQPAVFKVIYSYSMKDQPMLVEDGMKIAKGLSGHRPYSKINKTLSRGSIGEREIYHFEDIRKKIRTARAVSLVSCVGLLMVGVACAARWWRVLRMSLIWFGSSAVVATVWAMIHFRHFFRSLHWWIFQDDTWILPKGCYSLKLYPYAVWQTAGAVVLIGLLFLLVLGCVIFRPKGRKDGKGEKGAKGAKGAKGPKGPKGPKASARR